MAAVIAFAFEAVRQTRHDDRLLGLGSCGAGLGNEGFVRFLGDDIIALGIGDAGHTGKGIHQALGLEGVDMAAAAALEAGLHRELTDHGHFLALAEGQHVIFVFQQHHALGSQLACLRVLGFLIPHGVGLGVVQIPLVDGQNALHRQIHIRFVQLAIAHGLHDQLIVLAAGCRHFQIQTRMHALDPVAHRAPVAHHVAIEAPFTAKELRQQLAVLGGVLAIEPVVGAHHRPRLAVLHRAFESRIVDFPQRALIHHAVGSHAAMLLRVGREVFHAHADIPGLHRLDKAGGQFRRQVGILAEILKIAAAQGAALDVHRRAQNHGHLLVLAAVAHALAHLTQHVPVKAGRRGAGRGIAHRLDALVDAQMVGLQVLLTKAVGAVADHYAGDAQTLHALGVPEVQTR